MHEDLVLDLWVGLKEYFDKKGIETIASKYIDILLDHGVSDAVLKSSTGHDEDLDAAIAYYFDEEDEEYDED